MSAQETYDQAKNRLKVALNVAILPDIIEREVYRRHYVEEGMDCPGSLSHGTVAWEAATLLWNWYCRESKEAGQVCPTLPLKGECETVLTEPDEGWQAFLLKREQDEEARLAAAELGQANGPRIKVEEDSDEEMPLADVLNRPPRNYHQAHSSPVAVAAHQENQARPNLGLLTYQDDLEFKCSQRNFRVIWLFVPTSEAGYRYHVFVNGTLIQVDQNEPSKDEAREAVALKALATPGIWRAA
ncbi:hypothetical protein B0T20DRAFT_349114 [Sordaria brevicollis]|uniref:Uncharacterized protein n=1 Tax=Sordaria brevicollis TaxID=83679 RepID=A0AAE0PGI0_SORBR|nr:hypothetical protein B0T20DRAFT_349114 [Sordaria brevicollis]